MKDGTTSKMPADWLDTAVRHQYLTAEQSGELRQHVRQQELAPSQLAIEHGLMSAVQCDIVEALTEPAAVTPGFELIDVMGHGGLGVVYRARQVNLDRQVALKTVLLSRLDQPSTLARFRQEAKAIGTLRHPNIVTAFDSGTHKGRVYLAMELVEGEDLQQRIARTDGLAEFDALSVARQVAAGLAHADHQGLVHRDIKPANILLTHAPEGFPLPEGIPLAKITDFGLALLANEQDDTRLTMAGTTMGTVSYMAPEQIDGSTVDRRADIYSLGATLFHMLTGAAPFEGKTIAEVLAVRLQGRGPNLARLVGKISPACAKLVGDMLENEVTKRPQDYATLLTRFDQAMENRAVAAQSAAVAPTTEFDAAATHASAASQATPESGRRKLRLATAMMVGTLALGCLLALFVLRRNGQSALAPVSNYVSSGWEAPLFDGSTLDGWDPALRGNWGQGRDEEGGYILHGAATANQSASLRRSLPLPDDRALDEFGIRMGIDPRTASTIDIRFGPASGEGAAADGSDPFILRIADHAVQLGRWSSAQSAFVSLSPKVELTPAEGTNRPLYFSVAIDHIQNQWQVFVDQKFVGAALGGTEADTNSLSLLVEKGEAYFEGLRLVELVEVESQVETMR